MTDERPGTGEDLGLIEKAFLMGVGAASLAKDKAEELADELVRRGKITREQSDSFVSRLADRADEATRSAQYTVAREADRVVSVVGLASSREIESLREELSEIKALLASLRPQEGESGQS